MILVWPRLSYVTNKGGHVINKRGVIKQMIKNYAYMKKF